MNISEIEVVSAVPVPVSKCYYETWQCLRCDKEYPCQVTMTADFNDQRSVLFTAQNCLNESDAPADWRLIGHA